MKCFSLLVVLLVAGAYAVCENGVNHAAKRFLNCGRITNPRKCMAVEGACAWRDEAEIVSAREFEAADYDLYDAEEAELFEAEEEWADDGMADEEYAEYDADYDNGADFEFFPDDGYVTQPRGEHHSEWFMYLVATIAVLMGCFLCLVVGCGMGACAAILFGRYSKQLERQSKQTEVYEPEP